MEGREKFETAMQREQYRTARKCKKAEYKPDYLQSECLSKKENFRLFSTPLCGRLPEMTGIPFAWVEVLEGGRLSVAWKAEHRKPHEGKRDFSLHVK